MTAGNPLLQWPALVAAMLSLSIGWGIRGNFGHEAGAMVPGALCALAVCLFSRREDWLRRAPYFALFGALGWGFGGSIAYMPPLGYTHSGQLATQLYGFCGCFLIGFLWASLGGAGTAYAALERRERLAEIVKPLGFVVAVWALEYVWWDDFAAWYQQAQGVAAAGSGDFRHRDPFYWLDSEWIEAGLALAGLAAWDLWDRRFSKLGWLGGLAAAGAAVGAAVQYGLQGLGWLEPLLRAVVQPQGDLTLIDPATGQPHALAEFLTNFPPVFSDLAPHMGWLFGLLAGVTVYFARFGKWSSGSRLLLAMTVGSLAAFVAGPVLLSNLFGGVGGFRFTPPRGDSWANTLGALLGLVWYMRRRGLPEVATAALMSGVIGGLGLMAAQFVKLLAFMPGNPVVADEAAQKAWAHWHSMNWHSIATEQGVGLVYGLAVLVPMALLAVLRKPADETGVEDRGARAFAVFFVLNVVPYLNLVKNVGDWTKAGAVPVVLKAPLVGWIEWPALWWFNGMAVLIALATVALLRVQMRFGLAVLPATAVGRAQVIYLLLLWPMVVGNFERALVKFHENRLATEGTIFVNALLVTLLVVAHAAGPKFEGWSEGLERRRLSIRTAGAGVLLVVVLAGGFTAVVRSVYGDRHDGWGRRNLRFGEEADWRVKPILKTGQHR